MGKLESTTPVSTKLRNLAVVGTAAIPLLAFGYKALTGLATPARGPMTIKPAKHGKVDLTRLMAGEYAETNKTSPDFSAAALRPPKVLPLVSPGIASTFMYPVATSADRETIGVCSLIQPLNVKAGAEYQLFVSRHLPETPSSLPAISVFASDGTELRLTATPIQGFGIPIVYSFNAPNNLPPAAGTNLYLLVEPKGPLGENTELELRMRPTTGEIFEDRLKENGKRKVRENQQRFVNAGTLG